MNQNIVRRMFRWVCASLSLGRSGFNRKAFRVGCVMDMVVLDRFLTSNFDIVLSFLFHECSILSPYAS